MAPRPWPRQPSVWWPLRLFLVLVATAAAHDPSHASVDGRAASEARSVDVRRASSPVRRELKADEDLRRQAQARDANAIRAGESSPARRLAADEADEIRGLAADEADAIPAGASSPVRRLAADEANATISVAVFLPFSNSEGQDYQSNDARNNGVVAAMAAQQFNQRNGSIVSEFATLPRSCDGLKLNATMWNTFMSPEDALSVFVGETMPRVDPDVIVGATFSSVSSPLSQLAGAYGVPTISYASTAPQLDTKDLFPNFMRTVPADTGMPFTGRCRADENDWRAVGIIAVDDTFGRGYAEILAEELDIFQSTETTTILIPLNNEAVVRDLLHLLRDKRIFFTIFGSVGQLEMTGRAAIDLNMTGPDFAWTHAWDLRSLVPSPDPATWKVSELIAHEFLRGSGSIGVSGFVPGPRLDALAADFARQDASDYAYFANTGGPQAAPRQAEIDGGLTDSYAGFVFDAVSTVGLGACEARRKRDLGLLTAMTAQKFEGVSGSVRFDPKTFSRPSDSALYELQNLVPIGGDWSRVEVNQTGVWTGTSADSSGWDDSRPFIFYDGTSTPPWDGVTRSCGAGTYLWDNECLACPAGTSQSSSMNVGSADSCIGCNETAYSASGAAECTSCPQNSFIPVAANAHDGIARCVCDKDYYATEWPLENACRSCPDNARCQGGMTGPFPDEGYWLAPYPPRNHAETYRCRYNWICKGGKKPGTCQPLWMDAHGACVDYEGNVTLTPPKHWCERGWDHETPLCAGEMDGFWYLDTQAIECKSSGAMKDFLMVVGFAVILILFFSINDIIRPQYPVLDAVLTSYQDMGIITLYWFDWSEKLSSVFFIFRIALFDVDVYEPTCSLEWGFNEAFRMMLALPLVMAAIHLFTWAIRLRSLDEACGGALSFFIDAQASLLYYCFSVFECRGIRAGKNVQHVYVEESDASCETESTIAMRIIATLYLGLIAIVTYCVLHRLARAAYEDDLNDETVLARYGFMYKRFRMGALWWGICRLLKQFALVLVLVYGWQSPEDQAVWALIVLTVYGFGAARWQPSQLHEVNNSELAGVGITIVVVCLGLSFTSLNNDDGLSDKAEWRYVGYFAAAQILYLIGASWATFRDVWAVRARLHVAKQVNALHSRVVRARRRGRLRSQMSFDLESTEDDSSSRRAWRALRTVGSAVAAMSGRDIGATDTASRRVSFFDASDDPEPSTERRAAAFASRRSSVSSGDSNAPSRRRSRLLRRSRSLNDHEVFHLARHGRAVAETEGRIEVLDTFRGPALRRSRRPRRILPFRTKPSTAGYPHDLALPRRYALSGTGADARAIVGLVALDRVVGSAVADNSVIGNFSRQHEARFFNKLAKALPGMLDYTLAANRVDRSALSAAIRSLAAFDRTRREVGAGPIAMEIVEPVDRSSLLHYSIFADQRDLNVLRAVVDGMIDADPRLRAKVEAVRAPIRVAVRIQRAWRRRKAQKGAELA